MPPLTERIRLAELLASLSLATDLGTGQQLGHGMRSCQLSVALGRAMGCDSERLRSIYQVSLLRFLGCTSDAAESAEAVGGDDIGLNAVMSPVFVGETLEGIRALAGFVGRDERLVRRGRLLLGMLTDTKGISDGMRAHCEVAAMLAHRLDVAEDVIIALRHAYERWDGKGYPDGQRGEAIPLEVRVCTVARDVDVLLSAGANPAEVAMSRRGKGYDPAVVDAWLSLDSPHPEADWDSLMAAEPEPHANVRDLAATLTAMADFVDLKSPWTRGHSRRVAQLSHDAATEAGLPADQADEVARAGLVHDVGRVGVSNGVWDKPGTLSADEWERVRLHPYLTSRVLSRCPNLSGLAALASSHHERLDGSGYHSQLRADQISGLGRILAAADVLDALQSDRPHRKALSRDEAFSALSAEADAGGLDADAVACVIAAAGGELDRPASAGPGGLSEREIEVLRHIASGMTNREVGEVLFISAKTVGRHVENIYTKIGVSTRAAAAVYAMEHHILR